MEVEEDVQEEVLSVWRAEHGIVADKGLMEYRWKYLCCDWKIVVVVCEPNEGTMPCDSQMVA